MHVVPHHPARDSIVLWVQAEQSETGWSLSVRGPGAVEVATWDPEAHPPTMLPNVAVVASDTRVWTWPVEGLAPGTDYEVRFTGVEAPEEAATFRTLPADLERPFTVLLGSCYCEDSDLPDPVVSTVVRVSARQRVLKPVVAIAQQVRHAVVAVRSLARRGPVGDQPLGHVSRRYRALPTRPDLKLLVGDQVYLDAPWYWFVGVPLPTSPVTRHVSATYSRTWEKLAWMLSHGANICISDDHEFWNDYPWPPPALTVFMKFWRHSFRARWEEEARRFLTCVQLPRALSTFAIGAEVEFLVADTRMNRDAQAFMAEEDFASLLDRIAGLRAPGVLVMGQPVLAPGESRRNRFVVTDHNLGAYRDQYDRLCLALAAAPHDVLVLAGDVHFGRVVEVDLPRPDGGTRRLAEVVASPMALVPLAGSSFDARGVLPGLRLPLRWCPQFGDQIRAAHGRRPVLRSVTTIESGDKPCPDHYTTLAFSRGPAPGSVRVEVTAWSLQSTTGEGPGEVLMRRQLALA